MRHRHFLALVVACGAVYVFDLRYHEFWRDESQALVMARDAPWDLFPAIMRLEGVPPLFHLLLRLAGSLLPSPVALTAVGVLGYALLLAGTYNLLVAISGSVRASFFVTVLFAATYTFSYELGVVVRQYGGALGLTFLSFAHLREGLRLARRRDVVLGTVFGALATLYSPPSACVAGGGFVAFAALAMLDEKRFRFGWPVVFALPCFALTFLLMLPWKARWPTGNVNARHPLGDLVRLSKQALVRGIVPSDWWAAALWQDGPTQALWGMLRHFALAGIVLAVAVAMVARLHVIARRPSFEAFDVLAIVVGWIPLFEIFSDHYWGSYRHMLFLGIPSIVITGGWAIDARIDARLMKWIARAWFPLAAPWFALEAALLWQDLALDVALPFSETKMAAFALPADAHVVSDSAWLTLSLLLWKPGMTLRSPSGFGRYYRFTVIDNGFEGWVPVRPLVIDECTKAPSRVYYVGGSVEARCLRNLGHSKVRVSDLAPHMAALAPNDEQFDISHVDCACLGVSQASGR